MLKELGLPFELLSPRPLFNYEFAYSEQIEAHLLLDKFFSFFCKKQFLDIGPVAGLMTILGHVTAVITEEFY